MRLESSQDLGLVVDGSGAGKNGYQLAAGLSAAVAVLDPVDWVRKIIVFFKGSVGSTANLVIASVDPSDTVALSSAVTISNTTTQALTCDGAWHSYTISEPVSLLGKRGYLAVTNSHASVALNANLRVQLMGGA